MNGNQSNVERLSPFLQRVLTAFAAIWNGPLLEFLRVVRGEQPRRSYRQRRYAVACLPNRLSIWSFTVQSSRSEPGRGR